MATLRNVTVVTSKQDGTHTFLSAASNKRELIQAFADNGVEYNDNLRIMLRAGQGQASPVTDTSVLPDEEIIIFISPKKVKSGK